jgi:Dolichyl-phosphate-mannose-protein mannosyltransferase
MKTSSNTFTLTNATGNYPGLQKKQLLLFFFSLLFFLTLMNFQGLDLNDEGFHATQYQQFFSNPRSVQYTFIFWFSGFVGGLFYKIFSFAGLWGLRFAGALVTTLTAFVAYKLLRNHVRPIILLLSLALLAALSIQAGPRDLYYNNLSAFLYILSIFFLYKGLEQSKFYFLFISGVIAGINVFTRLPNVLGAGLILTILYYQILQKETVKAFLSRYLLFIAGFIVSIFFVFALMYFIGDLDVFFDSVKSLYTTNNTASVDDGLSGSYGIGNLVKLLVAQYLKCMVYALIVFALIIAASLTEGYLQTIAKGGKAGRIILQVIVAAVLLALLYSNKLPSGKISFLLTGICLITGAVTMLAKTSSYVKILTFAGLFFILVHPFGSATGISTVVPYSLWISLPLSFQFLMSLHTLTFKSSFEPGYNNIMARLRLNYGLIQKNFRTGLFVLIIFTTYWLYIQPYFGDFHKRTDMFSGVDNKNMQLIYTSKERSRMVNELLNASKLYIKPNDVVLAYDCIPMFHFMTETIPYLSNPAPWFYSNGVFRDQLNNAYTSTGYLPVIIRQSIKIIEDDGSRWPEVKTETKYAAWERNKYRNKLLDAFIADHHYKKAWANESFEIYIP